MKQPKTDPLRKITANIEAHTIGRLSPLTCEPYDSGFCCFIGGMYITVAINAIAVTMAKNVIEVIKKEDQDEVDDVELEVPEV